MPSKQSITGLKKGKQNSQAAERDRPYRSDSNQSASTKVGVVQDAAVMLEVGPDGQLLVRLRVPGLAHVAVGQVKAVLVLAMPALECVLHGIAELTDGQADPRAQLDIDENMNYPFRWSKNSAVPSDIN